MHFLYVCELMAAVPRELEKKNRKTIWNDRSVASLFLIPRLRYCATSYVRSIFTKGQKLQLAALTEVRAEAIDPRRSWHTLALAMRYIVDNIRGIGIL